METTVSTVVKCENSLLAGMEKSRRYIPVREIASDTQDVGWNSLITSGS